MVTVDKYLESKRQILIQMQTVIGEATMLID